MFGDSEVTDKQGFSEILIFIFNYVNITNFL